MTGEIQPIYKKNVEDAREKYRNAGYQNVRCIGAIITHISPDDFYTMTLQFFGDTMDLDFAREPVSYTHLANGIPDSLAYPIACANPESGTPATLSGVTVP